VDDGDAQAAGGRVDLLQRLGDCRGVAVWNRIGFEFRWPDQHWALLAVRLHIDLFHDRLGLGDLVGRAGDQDGVVLLVGGDVVHADLGGDDHFAGRPLLAAAREVSAARETTTRESAATWETGVALKPAGPVRLAQPSELARIAQLSRQDRFGVAGLDVDA